MPVVRCIYFGFGLLRTFKLLLYFLWDCPVAGIRFQSDQLKVQHPFCTAGYKPKSASQPSNE